MRHIDGKGDQFAVDKNGPDNGKVAGMGAARERIVGQENVAGQDISAELADQRANLCAKGAGEQRDAVHLRHQLTLGSQNTASKVQNLVDHRAHGCARHHDAHFIDRSDQLAFDDFLGDWIRCHAVIPAL